MAGRRSWAVWEVLIIAVDSGCELAENLSARPSDGFEEADYPGKVFLGGKVVILAAISESAILTLMADDLPQRRWFCPTPGWLVLGLLAVEGLLWLSEQFHWFGFNSHKGWPVLIALASVGIVFVLMLLWFAVALVFRWRFQFSIRSLLVLVVAVALPFSWLAVETKRARERKEAVQAIGEWKGFVNYDYQVDESRMVCLLNAKPPGPPWLRTGLGEDFFANIVGVGLTNAPITDAWLERLEGMPQLQWLYLDDTGITDAGLKHLVGLTRLTTLDLSGTEITDTGLEYLEGMTELQQLEVGHTQVTDAGVKKLQQALPKCQISR